MTEKDQAKLDDLRKVYLLSRYGTRGQQRALAGVKDPETIVSSPEDLVRLLAPAVPPPPPKKLLFDKDAPSMPDKRSFDFDETPTPGALADESCSGPPSPSILEELMFPMPPAARFYPKAPEVRYGIEDEIFSLERESDVRDAFALGVALSVAFLGYCVYGMVRRRRRRTPVKKPDQWSV